MIPYTAIAPLNGWRSAMLIVPPHLKELSVHTFDATSDRQLVHLTDDQVRAIVPPEGWDDYCQQWPEAADMVRQLRAAAQDPGQAEDPQPPQDPA